MSLTDPAHLSIAERLRDVQVGTRQELEVSRHVFRGEPSYVVHDPITFRAHELGVPDYQVFVELDGKRSLGQIFKSLVDDQRVGPDREEEFYGFVVHLNQLGLLNLPVSDGKSLYDRFEKKRRARRRGRVTGALFLRIPLCHPDAFLERTMPYVAPLFTRMALVAWSVAVVLGLLVLLAQWDEFRSPLGTMLALSNLPLLWILLIVLKLGHELGHAYACKHFGGRVPEMGAFLILLTPCAYVDASASWSFPSRAQRMVVSLAGMYFESILALIALAVWSFTGPSMVHSAAQYAIVLSTVVTIGFNINPLMRYDGYYLVSDLVNSPNLRQRATAQLLVSLKQLVLGIRTAQVGGSRAARVGLCAFGAASGAYKALVLLGISAIVALKLPVVGLGVGVAYLAATFWSLASRLVRYVWLSDEVAPVRRRAVVMTLLLVAAGPLALLALPTPGSIRSVGVVRQRDDRIVRATGSGLLAETDVEVGDVVGPGSVLCVLENIDLTSEVRRKRAEIRQLEVQLYQTATDDPHQGSVTAQRLLRAQRDWDRVDDLADGLTVTSPVAGRVTEATGLEDRGRMVRMGEPLATVSAGPWVVRSVATEETMAQSAPSVGDRVEVRLTSSARHLLVGRVTNIAEAGSRTIDQQQLTHLGGGDIAVSAGTHEAEAPFFEITIALEAPRDVPLRHGMTAIALLEGGRTPLALHLYRRTLQFLNRLRASG